MTGNLEQLLRVYGELTVKVGLNLQPGQRLLIIGPLANGGASLESAPLVRHIAASAYRAGAPLVETLWGDEALQLARFTDAPRESFGETSAWLTRALVEIEMAAHGGSVVEIEKTTGKWRVVRGSRFNRRISARSTAISISGPAAGHERLRTTADPTGRRVIGTFANCAGGVTPWMKIAGMAEAFNLPIVSHVMPEILVHVVAACPNGLTVEYMPWMLALYEETPAIEDGELVLSDKPGLGLKFDEKAIAAFKA